MFFFYFSGGNLTSDDEPIFFSNLPHDTTITCIENALLSSLNMAVKEMKGKNHVLGSSSDFSRCHF